MLYRAYDNRFTSFMGFGFFGRNTFGCLKIEK